MTDARLRHAFAGEAVTPSRALSFPIAWGASRFPNSLHAHGSEGAR
jgi:hypothetical protein